AAAARNWEGRVSILQGVRCPAGRPRLHHLRPAELVHLHGPFSYSPAQGQSPQEDAVLGHGAATPADHRLAEVAPLRGWHTARLLWAELRRQIGNAYPGLGDQLLPVDLLSRLQRMGLEKRLDAQSLQLCLARRIRDL